MEAGYYYFRNVGNRILFGGGRNLDFSGETTTSFETSELIQNKLEELLRTRILPHSTFETDYAWSGIMAVGSEKKPIIEKTNKNIAFGVRMGGMGVAIGASVGKKLSNLFL
jgi:glycine/D-amino acid oxidase-like deaminating enzyme